MIWHLLIKRNPFNCAQVDGRFDIPPLGDAFPQNPVFFFSSIGTTLDKRKIGCAILLRLNLIESPVLHTLVPKASTQKSLALPQRSQKFLAVKLDAAAFVATGVCTLAEIRFICRAETEGKHPLAIFPLGVFEKYFNVVFVRPILRIAESKRPSLKYL